MNNNEMKRIEERLIPPAAPEPPEGLLESVQREIPEHLHLVEERSESTLSPRRLRLIAASVAVVVLGGFLALRVAKQPGPSLVQRLENPAAREVEATAGRVVAETESVDRITSVETDGKTSTPSAQVEGTAQEAFEVEASTEKKFRENLAAEKAASAKAKKEAETGAAQDRQSLAALGYLAGDEQAARDALTEQKRREMLSPLRKLSAKPQGDPGLFDTANAPRADTDALASNERRQRQRALEEQPRSGVAQREIREVPDKLSADVTRVTVESPVVVGESYSRPATPPAQAVSPSTGGTQEPNDAPYGDMFFKSYGTNPFIDTEDDAQSTFGLDVDTGSFTLARSYIERGHLPPGEAIRVEEFVNYFDYGDPAPRRGEFTITAEGAPSPFASGPRYQLVRFGIKGREITNAERKPAMLIFVIDVSGSMRRENRLGLVKRSLELLLDQLQPQDQVGLVVYGNQGRVVLEPTSDKYAIERAIERLRPEGVTNAEEGLTLAYDLARTYRRRGSINRIILCSDGVANVGRTDAENILEKVRRWTKGGIELTTVGFGMGNFNDVLMEQLADQGDGRYAYVDDLDEAHRVFVENLTGTLLTIASDARAQVEFDPRIVRRYRLVGYENRDMADRDFRNDSADAGEIGAGHGVTALYELELSYRPSPRDRIATLRLRYRSESSGEFEEDQLDVRGSSLSRRWKKASPSFRLTTVVAEFGDLLRSGDRRRLKGLEDTFLRAQKLSSEFPGDHEVAELVALIGRAARLAEREQR